jgi:surface protein
MFADDPNLTSLNLSSFDTGKVQDDGWIFLKDRSLCELTLGNKTKISSEAGLPGDPDKYVIEKLTIDNQGHKKGDTIPDSNPQRQASGSGWMALGKNGTPTDPKGKLYKDAKDFIENRTPEKETYVWEQDSTPSTPTTPTTPATPTTPSTSSSSSSSSSSTTTSTPSTSSSTSSQPSNSSSSTNLSLPNYAAAKGTVVYAINKIGLYQSAKFSTTNRRTWYTKKPRIYRPMFVVTGYSRDSNGRLRYQVRDVNHTSKTDGKTGYITASQAYVRPVYYATKHATVTVINPRGVVAYRKANLTKRVKNYRQGTVLHVKGIVTHNLTTRYVLTNGDYITANRKLVNMGRHKQVKVVETKRGINRYANRNLTKRNHAIAKNKTLKVYGYDYSHGNSVTKHGALRYRVAGGYITANTKYVHAYK